MVTAMKFRVESCRCEALCNSVAPIALVSLELVALWAEGCGVSNPRRDSLALEKRVVFVTWACTSAASRGGSETLEVELENSLSRRDLISGEGMASVEKSLHRTDRVHLASLQKCRCKSAHNVEVWING